MTGPTRPDSILLEKLLDTYKLTRPVPGEVQHMILSSKKKNFLRILKTTGSFTALYGIFISIYYALKKIGLWFPLSKSIISGIAVASISYGGYLAVTGRMPGSDRKNSEGARAIQNAVRGTLNAGTWIDQIILYNGKMINGAILSRGETYEIMTAGGRITIPKNQIKIVRPATRDVTTKKP